MPAPLQCNFEHVAVGSPEWPDPGQGARRRSRHAGRLICPPRLEALLRRGVADRGCRGQESALLKPRGSTPQKFGCFGNFFLKSDPRGHPGLKLCVHVSVMGYYRFINFHQNRRGSGIFLGDFTWNYPYVNSYKCVYLVLAETFFCIFQHFQNKVAEIRRETKFWG